MSFAGVNCGRNFYCTSIDDEQCAEEPNGAWCCGNRNHGESVVNICGRDGVGSCTVSIDGIQCSYHRDTNTYIYQRDTNTYFYPKIDLLNYASVDQSFIAVRPVFWLEL